MELFTRKKPLIFVCPMCNRVFKHNNWIVLTQKEWEEIKERESTIDRRVYCNSVYCSVGETYQGGEGCA